MLFLTRKPRKKNHKKPWAKKAFEADILPHIHALYGTALRMTRSKAEAEDLVQETYLRALNAKESYTPGTNGKAWLFKIQTNTFINKYRRKVREREILAGSKKHDALHAFVRPDGKQPTLDPENALVDRFLSDEVLEALETLSVDYRTVVLLSDIQGFSYKEVAEMVDVPVGTVMSRLFRARRLLQEKLFDYALSEGILKNKEAESGEPLSLETYRMRRAADR